MLSSRKINCKLDFESAGKRLGYLSLLHSDNENSYGEVPVPTAVIKNGFGPTLFLSAGNHGDGYEGQVILRRLFNELNPDDINGRLIIMPALIYPAVMANQRIPPLGKGNLNHSFPGDEFGRPTSAIADFVIRKIMPMCDAGIDLHSGGSMAYYLSCGYLCSCDDIEVMRKSVALSESFNAPYVFLVDGRDGATGFDPVAQKSGVLFISAELGGGANVDINAAEIGMTGVKNILQHLGIQDTGRSWQPNTIYLNGIDGCYHLKAPYSGLSEPLCQLGDNVSEGQIAGNLYSIEEVDRTPLDLVFKKCGTIVIRKNGARVTGGDFLFSVVEEIAEENRSGLFS